MASFLDSLPYYFQDILYPSCSHNATSPPRVDTANLATSSASAISGDELDTWSAEIGSVCIEKLLEVNFRFFFLNQLVVVEVFN